MLDCEDEAFAAAQSPLVALVLDLGQGACHLFLPCQNSRRELCAPIVAPKQCCTLYNLYT